MQSRLSYSVRASFCKNVVAKQLFHLMSEKKTNLSLSADVIRAEELLYLAETIGSEICVFKTHIDILEDFSPAVIKALQKIADAKKFLIFEDRKFADIGNTVKHQYQQGIYHIADWAHMINAHTLPGPGIIAGLAEGAQDKPRALLLLAEMSSANNLFTESYTQKTLEMAAQFPEFVIGFISQRKLSSDPSCIYMTPGVQLSQRKDPLGQQYITPEKAIISQETDIIIVGRGILQAEDPFLEAQKYRQQGWAAYEKSIANL